MDDDALNRAKRALAVVPRGADDALSRAKRALTPADAGAKLDGLLERARAAARPNPPPAVIGKDTARTGDLLTRAKALARPAPKPAVPVEPPPIAVREEVPATHELRREPPRNSPPVVIAAPRPTAPAPRPVEVLPAEVPSADATAQNVTVHQTVVVQVAAAPAYPYPYPYYWPYWAGCPRWSCPARSGLPCNRSWLTCGRW